jgi:NADH pyrophosphatase NudC (nudix superfamily)
MCTEDSQKINKDVSLSFSNVRASAGHFSAADLAIVGNQLAKEYSNPLKGQGRALMNWHKTNSHCSNCGNVSIPSCGGYSKLRLPIII